MEPHPRGIGDRPTRARPRSKAHEAVTRASGGGQGAGGAAAQWRFSGAAGALGCGGAARKAPGGQRGTREGGGSGLGRRMGRNARFSHSRLFHFSVENPPPSSLCKRRLTALTDGKTAILATRGQSPPRWLVRRTPRSLRTSVSTASDGPVFFVGGLDGRAGGRPGPRFKIYPPLHLLFRPTSTSGTTDG